MGDWKSEVKEIVFDGHICVPYSWTVGSTLSKWYGELRENGQIWANRCPSCGKVFVPPKFKCIDCYADVNEWLPIPGTGSVETFTVVRYEEPGMHPRKAPFVYAIIKMDGADTGMLHFIDEVDPDQVKVGMRVEAVISDEREGNILDIKHFRPVS